MPNVYPEEGFKIFNREFTRKLSWKEILWKKEGFIMDYQHHGLMLMRKSLKHTKLFVVCHRLLLFSTVSLKTVGQID